MSKHLCLKFTSWYCEFSTDHKICNVQLSHIYFHSALSSQKTQVRYMGPARLRTFQECLPPLLLLITLNSLIRSHLLPLHLFPLPPPSASPSRRTRTAPHTPSLASHTPADSPEDRSGRTNIQSNGLKTLKSCAAMELAGELGFGSLSRDWMLVRMADTS